MLATHKTDYIYQLFYRELQINLRKFIGEITADEVLQNRNKIGEYVEESTKEDLNTYGISLISADVRDIMFPGDLKQLFASELKAKKEGLAALERARGESAALRNLSNTAKLMDNNPSLLQLRLIQSLNESSGNTLVLYIDPDVATKISKGKKK